MLFLPSRLLLGIRHPKGPQILANSSPTNEAKRSPTFVSLNFNSKESQNNLLSESSSIDLPASLRTISALHFPRIERLNRPFVPALSVPTRIPTPFPSAMPSPQPLYTPTLFPPPMTDSQNSSPEEIPFGWETRNYSAEEERSLYSETIHVRQVNVRDARHFILEMFTELVNFYTKFDERSIRHELLHYNVSFFIRKMSTEYGPELSSIMDEFGRRCTIKFGGDQFEGSSESVSPQQICMMGTLLTISRNISGKLRDYEQLHVEYEPTSSRSSQRTEHGSSYGDKSNLSFAAEAFADPEDIEAKRTMSPGLSYVSGEAQNENNELFNAAREGEETSKSEGEESGEQNQEMPMPSTTSSPMVINPAHTALFGCMQFVTPFFNSVLADWKAAVGELRQQGMITADMTLHALSELSSPEFVKLVDSQIKLFSDEQRTSMDPAKFSGIKKLYLPSDQIWTPDILLYNNADGEPHISIVSDAIVYFTGLVVWKPPSIYKSFCASA
uniref:Neur_chan_LBD domain-containing protein n=1 Tax=Globodera pallida TaxID=36090 RepID=A0A183CGM2_GLOPA